MGATISSLVFRPPRPTKIKPDRFFYIEVEPPDIASTLKFTCSPTCVPDSSSISLSSSQSDDDMAVAAVDNLCYHPQRNSKQTSNANANDASSSSSSLRIPAFFLLRRGAKLTILYSHGNAEDLGMMYRRMKELARVLCVNVLAYDYSGYGLSQPKGIKPTEQLCYRNIEAAYGYLVNVMKIPPHHIVLYGRSLGSGPSCHLAKKTALEGKSVAGLILHSPFLSIYRIVLDVKSGMVGDMFRSYTTAKDIKCPVFVIHGKEDAVVPFWHGDELLRSFPPQYRAQPFWVPNMGHNNIEHKWKQEYIERVTEFLTKYCHDQTGNNNNNNAKGSGHAPKMMEIPENERYMPGWSLNESGKVLVNQTWVKHGPTIVHNAVKVTKAQHPHDAKKAAKTTAIQTAATQTAAMTKPTASMAQLSIKEQDIYRERSRASSSANISTSASFPSACRPQQHSNPYSGPQTHQQEERYGYNHMHMQTELSIKRNSSASAFTNVNAEAEKIQPPNDTKRNRPGSILARLLIDEDDPRNEGHEIRRTISATSQYIETQESWATEEDINNCTFDSKVCIGGNHQMQTTPAALALEFLQQQQLRLQDQRRKEKQTQQQQQEEQTSKPSRPDDNYNSSGNSVTSSRSASISMASGSRSRSRSSGSHSVEKKMHANPNYPNVPLDNLTNRNQMVDGTTMSRSHSRSLSPSSQF